jgi:hypothetical protein
MVADCVPILLAAKDASCVAAIHAGWRGLAAGVIEETIKALPVPPEDLVAEIGPCISAKHYEVGPEVIENIVYGRFFVSNKTTGLNFTDAICNLFSYFNIPASCKNAHCSFSMDEITYSFRRDKDTGATVAVALLRQ